MKYLKQIVTREVSNKCKTTYIQIVKDIARLLIAMSMMDWRSFGIYYEVHEKQPCDKVSEMWK